MKQPITLQGDKDVWLDFTIKLKKEKKKFGKEKEVWAVLEPFIKEYIRK